MLFNGHYAQCTNLETNGQRMSKIFKSILNYDIKNLKKYKKNVSNTIYSTCCLRKKRTRLLPNIHTTFIDHHLKE